MERMDNIMRTTRGLHTAAHQRLPQQSSAPGQRQPAPGRKPLPEQHGRLGNSNRAPGLYRSHLALPPRAQEEQEEQWEEGIQQPAHPTSRTSYGSQRAPRLSQAARYIEQPPQGDYYEEERSTVVPADVQEEWGDDTAGMRYGDWENEPGYHYGTDQRDDEYTRLASRPRETRPAREISPVGQRLAQLHGRNDPLATRELYRVPPETPRPTLSREARLPVPGSGSQLAPALPGQHSQQRTTQPLKPQQVARLNVEMQQRALVKASQEEDEHATVFVPAPYKNPTPVCPVCKGAGYLRQDVPFGHPGFGRPIQCECKQRDLQAKRRLQRQEASNLRGWVEKRFGNFQIDNTAPTQLREAYQIARAYAQDPNGWLVFMGKPGCGKTHLAAAIANQYLDTGETVLFITVSELLDHLRATFSPSSDIGYDKLFSQMRESSLLVLDDLGAQKSSPWANEKLFQLINYRYNFKMPTVITTNLLPSQNHTHTEIDDRVRSRMSDFSFVTTLNLDRVRDYRPNNPRRNEYNF